MLAKPELKIFLKTETAMSVSEIAERLDLSVPTVSKYVGLSIKRENGILQKNKIKRKVFVKRANTAHANLLTSIVNEFPRWDIADLFSHSNLKIASIMKIPMKITDIAFLTNISRQQVKNCLDTLSKVAIVIKKQNRYQLNPSQKLVIHFINSYYTHLNENRSKNNIILWQRGYEYLFKTKESSNEQKTATSVFHRYDLPLITNEQFYFHSDRNIDIKDHIIQTILIDPNSTTYNIYAALLYQKTKPDGIKKRAVLYDLEEHITSIIDYLNTKTTKKDYLPPWDEYESIARDYGVIG